jgi:hypothetical protein
MIAVARALVGFALFALGLAGRAGRPESRSRSER